MWGDEAAERHEMNEPSEPLAEDGTPRFLGIKSSNAEDLLWSARKRDVDTARDMFERRQSRLWLHMEERAVRGVFKPYEICGAQDAWHPRHKEGHPEYDEDDLVASCVCQLPKDHRDLGYRNHLEMTEDGKVWGSWS